MFEASLQKHTLIFKEASGTSRGILREKGSWFISIWDLENPDIIGTGEASIIKSLSPEWSDHYELNLTEVIEKINFHIDTGLQELKSLPSIHFAIETALLDLKNGGKKIFFPSDFTKNKASIPINGLIWMGNKEFMEAQIKNKIESGFDCLKMKIGAIDFETEVEILRSIRKKYSKERLELRVDANGAFTPKNVMGKLDILASLNIHSIEQPIKQRQYDEMKAICANTPLPIALDEELISLNSKVEKRHLLEYIKPQYIILKPSLVGGFESSDEWIHCAETLDIGWWITSALESNVGLNAIAQYTFTKNNPLPQGLGTGQLYTNNIESKLYIENGRLFHSV